MFSRLIGIARLALLFLFAALVIASPTFAQETDGGDGGKSYVMAYVLTFLVVILGMAAVCRPSNRADRPKMQEQDLEEKIRQMSAKGGE